MSDVAMNDQHASRQRVRSVVLLLFIAAAGWIGGYSGAQVGFMRPSAEGQCVDVLRVRNLIIEDRIAVLGVEDVERVSIGRLPYDQFGPHTYGVEVKNGSGDSVVVLTHDIRGGGAVEITNDDATRRCSLGSIEETAWMSIEGGTGAETNAWGECASLRAPDGRHGRLFLKDGSQDGFRLP